MQLNPFSGFVFLCGGILLFIAVYSWQRRAVIGARIFSLSMFFQCIYVLGYGFELSSLDLSSMLLWSKIQYVGVAGFPVLYLVFVLQYTGNESWLKKRNILLLYIIPVIYLALKLLDDHLLLIYSTVSINVSSAYPLLQFTRGPLYWVGPAYNLVIFFLGIIVLIREKNHASVIYQKQTNIMIIAALTPLAVFVFYLSGLVSIPALNNLDLNPFALSIWGLGLSWALFRYRLFDLAPIARETLVENLENGVIVLDLLCRVVDANPAARKIFNWKEIPIGQHTDQVFEKWGELAVLCYTSEQNLETTPPQKEISLECENRMVYYDALITLLKGKSGNRMGYLLVIHDITHRKQVEEALHELTLVDDLTGLSNRRGFNLLATQMMLVGRRMNATLLAFFADLDGFKRINDTLGHQVGDQALIETAQLLRNLFRSSDIIARIGGDEFVILAIETGDKSAESILARFENLVTTINNLPDRKYQLSISIGYAVFKPNSAQSLDELLSEADRAMYQQKQAKKQGVYS